MLIVNFKYKILRWFIKFHKEHAKINNREEKIIRIVKSLLKDTTTDLYIAPINNTRYIKTNDDSMFVIIHSDSVIISNHQYFYDISIGRDAFDELCAIFNKVTEMRRRKMEKEMLKNITASLENIANSLEEKENETV